MTAIRPMAEIAPAGFTLLAVLAASVVVRLIDGGTGLPAAALGVVATSAAVAALLGLSRLDGRVARLATPVLFGALLLWLWQMLVIGFAVPRVLLPSPAAIGQALATHADTLAADFRQTFIRSVIPGYAIGCGLGFLAALAIDRSTFLKRGLLPLGSLASAMPIVGVAPIMVMWFGFDWQSKAAVITVMTVFPMLVNTTAGLAEAGPMERDLMRSYAAGYWLILLKLRLPAALPFVFNALKLNTTLALIGGIVAEFFGTPIVGMGFRISTEVARMNIDVVWATIAVAALAGSLSYGTAALIERAVTFWHPSFRR
ncbi:MAG TPA: ABC transporter permease [Stellaceae bacterium]|nr:ABC transporter permease [Stellaceae bacterium]